VDRRARQIRPVDEQASIGPGSDGKNEEGGQ
jgi:hypothetical protein